MNIRIKKINHCDIENQVDQLANIIYQGFQFKFTKKLFNKQEGLVVITALCRYIISTRAENVFVSENNEQICGCLLLTTNKEKYSGLYATLKKELSFLQCIKLIFLLHMLSHKPKHNESYIDFIVVAPMYRNKGIGKSLLSYCQSISSTQKMTLHVAEQNKRAYRLYDNMGFKLIEKQSSFVTGLFVGFSKWRLMTWG